MALAEYTSRQEMIEAARLRRKTSSLFVGLPKPAPKVIEIQDPEPDPVIIEVKKVEPVNVTLQKVQEAVRDANAEPPRPSLKQLMYEVAGEFGLTSDDLKSAARNAGLIPARWKFCYRAATETLKSLPDIGRALQRDHTTILYSIRRHCEISGIPYPRGMTARKRGQSDRWKAEQFWTQARIVAFKELWAFGMPTKEIAHRLGCSRHAVSSARIRYELPPRYKSKTGADHGRP